MRQEKMKTISFYSYKGGVGRTTLMSQIARLLAGLGKRVIAVDFDFDAPGLHAAFNIEKEKIEKGLFDIVREFSLSEEHWKNENEIKQNLKKTLIETLKKVNIHKKLCGDDERGCIDVLPCSCEDENYWRSISQPRWMSFLAAPLKEERSLGRFMENYLKPTLEELMDYDYLLIDSRSGLSYYGGISQTISDSQVIVLCPTDNVGKFRKRMKTLKGFYPRDLEKKTEEIKKIYVVSRIPPELEFDTKEKFKEAETTINRFDNSAVLILHSDLDTLNNSHRRDFDERYFEQFKEEVVQLHEDILQIFVKLCQEAVPKTMEEPIHAVWRSLYKYGYNKTHQYRLYGFNLMSGEMFNDEDKNRNVAFKVVTFLRFLNKFYETLLITSDTRKNSIDMLNETLFNAGEQCGDTFGNALMEQWKMNDKLLTIDVINNNINSWCKFDTVSGFGKMTLLNKGIYEKDNSYFIDIEVENLFVVDSNTTEGRDYTAFFTGYVIGVLSKLIGLYEVKALSMKKFIKGKHIKSIHDNIYNENEQKYPYNMKSSTFDNGVLYIIEIRPIEQHQAI